MTDKYCVQCKHHYALPLATSDEGAMQLLSFCRMRAWAPSRRQSAIRLVCRAWLPAQQLALVVLRVGFGKPLMRANS
jgi:hypothetical protein